ncbi:MAG TPA: PAS domain-containing sensor histidine kinase [Ignavibacteriales bacterium]|nr:PAS domain-containing sensor histidine kinase [Ignavibacteriales bacterium]
MNIKNIPVEKKLFAGFVFSILLIGVLSIYLYESKMALSRQTLVLKSNNELRIHVNNLKAALNKLELDRKRYLLKNGQGDSIEYLKYLSDFKIEFQKLKDFVKKENLKNPYLDSLEVTTGKELSKLSHNYHLTSRLEKHSYELLKREEALINRFSSYLYQVDEEFEDKSMESFALYQEKLDDNLLHYFMLLIAFMILLSIYFAVIMRDTKKRKVLSLELEESRNNLDTIINTVPALIFVKNREKKFTLVNRYFLDFFRISKEKIFGRDSSELLRNGNRWIANEEDDEVIQNKIHINDIEREITLSDGKLYFLNVNKAPLVKKDGQVSGLVGVMNDVTKLIEYQNSLLQARKELEELNKQKNRFFSIIAHDLRSPFTGLLGISELLASDYEALPESDKKEFLVNIHNSVKNVWDLLNNLLTWSRIQFERIDFSPVGFSLSDVIGSVFKALRTPAENKEVRLISECPESAEVWGDVNMIETVLRNLVNNSIKFTNPGGYVKVSAEDRGGDSINICVSDSGIGMSSETAEKLFRPDQQTSRRGTAGEKGTGLGLLISEEFLRKHKGSFNVESEIGKGTRISFMLRKAGVQVPEEN